ncbi:unnamed protein product, partial [Hermetia illucens]
RSAAAILHTTNGKKEKFRFQKFRRFVFCTYVLYARSRSSNSSGKYSIDFARSSGKSVKCVSLSTESEQEEIEYGTNGRAASAEKYCRGTDLYFTALMEENKILILF